MNDLLPVKIGRVAMWKWTKIANIGALLGFFMPWLTVSCSGMPIASATGWQLATGGYSRAASEVASKSPPSGGGNLWLLLAIIAILAGIGIAFLSQSKLRARNLTLSSTAALVLIWIGTAKSTLMNQAARSADNNFNGSLDQAALAMMQLTWEVGYWLTVLALSVAAVMAGLTYLEENAMGERHGQNPTGA